MRVLIVTNMYPSDARPGDGIFVAREVEAIRRHRPDATLEVLHVRTGESRWRYVSGIRDVARAAKRFRPDVVHVHHGLTQVPALGWRGPRVVTYHGSDLGLGWQRMISHVAAALRPGLPIVVSAALKPLLQVADRPKARVIACGVDCERFAPGDRADARRALGWNVPAGETILGFPSSPSRRIKDYALFELVERELQERGVPVRVESLEGYRPDEVATYFRGLDALLMTSRREGSPVSTKEAMCVGTRVVSVDVGDMRSQVEGLSGCRIAASRDPRAIADAIQNALSEEPPDSSAAAERFSSALQAEAVCRAYEAAVGRS